MSDGIPGDQVTQEAGSERHLYIASLEVSDLVGKDAFELLVIELFQQLRRYQDAPSSARNRERADVPSGITSTRGAAPASRRDTGGRRSSGPHLRSRYRGAGIELSIGGP